MPGLLAPDIAAARLHLLQHIAIADLGADEVDTLAREHALKAKIGHDRRHHATAAQHAAPRPARADQRHDLVAVHDRARLVDDD